MSLILLIESTTNICSVALASNGNIICVKETTEPNAHSAKLTLFIKEIFESAQISANQLDAVAVSSGPGSYTGLRIGVSSAKGICYAVDCPLISIDTLEAMAYGIKNTHKDFEGLLCPMIDARRMEVYAAIFDKNLKRVRETQANIIGEGNLETYLENNSVLFFGNATEKTESILKSYVNASFDFDYKNSASDLLLPAINKLENKQFEDLAYYEPFYLKEYMAVKSQIKGLS